MLKNSLKRPDDYVFRLGGEEFGMLFKVPNVEYAHKIAEKVIENVETRHIEHRESETSSYITISMGLYIVELDDNNDSDMIYEMADRLLYDSKKSGRNKVTYSIQG